MNLAELSNDQVLANKLQKTRSPEEVVAVLKDYGIETTVEDLKMIIEASQEGELNESNLENVAGGIWLPILPLLPLIPWRPIMSWGKRK